MTEAGGGLFAGLSMAPASPAASPTKRKSAEPMQESTLSEAPTAPELAVNAPADGSSEAAPLSPSTQRDEARLESAPATDKLLGLLGAPAPAQAPMPAAAPVSSSRRPASTRKELFPPDERDKKGPKEEVAKKREKVKPKIDEEVLSPFSEDTTPSPRKKKQPTKENIISSSSLRGMGVVHPDTPIPNSDVALRVLRKFASKTRPMVSASHGGTQRRPILSYIFGMPSEYDRRFDAYRELISSILDGNLEEGSELQKEDDSVDKAEKARKVIARFSHLLSTWGHASAHMAEAERNSQYQAFCDILAIGLDTATALVTHGCLDGVMIGIGQTNDEYHKAVDFLAESVFASDLSQERNELSAMKFLLSTGCRVGVNGEAMLRGTHLLQTIRVLYHVYLSTFSDANKTTARASLQQLVTSVFIRMIASSHVIGTSAASPSEHKQGDEEFPTQDHRDAFLVLRSLCKLSMRSPPGGKLHSHIGLQASGSNSMWDSNKDAPSGSVLAPPTSPRRDDIQLVSTQAIHPALESKILALQLMLYVLQKTDMKGNFLQKCGHQFHYAIRNYLCVSLLKNCTSDNVQVVNLSLRVFVPIIHNFRYLLKAEIEAFVTNVFFVILDSPNSPIEHKSLVVTLFDEICSDPTTLAEIFLNYDCDLSAVDLFHRIVNTLSRVARTTEIEDENTSSLSLDLVTGAGSARMEKIRSSHRELRLDAMKALRQVLASLHASITKPMEPSDESRGDHPNTPGTMPTVGEEEKGNEANPQSDVPEKKSLVEIYDSKKKRREEESEVVLRFNQKPSAGISYAAKCGHIDGKDDVDVARYLLQNKDILEKTMIGEYLGREPEYQGGFSLRVLHAYVNMMDLEGLMFDDAIRFYLSGFRLPGEAQKIDRIMEKFAERYTAQNPEVFPTADVAFILAFSIIMLNTDLHNPAIKEERRMTKEGFIRNNRGICDGQDLPPDLLNSIFDRIKTNPISLKEDDDARERAGSQQTTKSTFIVPSLPTALSPTVFFTSHYDEMEKTKESNFEKERDQIVRTTESLLKRRRHGSSDFSKTPRKNRQNGHGQKSNHHVRYVRSEHSGLRDEYVSPMFEVAWGPALASFSTAMESANGTVGALFSIASDEEIEQAAENAAETIEVCLTGFRFAVCTAGLCGNDVARDAFMLALARFSQLGTGILLEPRHARCMQTMMTLARSHGELLGSSWEHVFKSLSEINRFHQLFQLMARNDKKVAAAADLRKSRLVEREQRLKAREDKKAKMAASDSLDEESVGSMESADLSLGDDLFSVSDDFDFNVEMDKKEIDEANARTVYEAVSEGLIEAIYERSSSLSTSAVKEFILQLCRVSRMEISHYGGGIGSNANQVDLSQVHYRQHHTLLSEAEGFHHHQPNIYNLQKLVEVAHYNMDSRPRLVFADLWTTVAAHLTSTALHSNSAVAMYAVDSFRQLSIQYLQREELGVFEFQRRFLKPLETVMSRSQLATTKELLLKCVERLILMFGSSDGNGRGGMLRSGWRPVLAVLGLAGRDEDEEIAKVGFDLLTTQLQPCLAPQKGTKEEKSKSKPGVLLAERFVDLVDALLIYVEGPHEDMGLKSIDNLLLLSKFLADDSFALPLIKHRPGASSSFDEEAEGNEGGSTKELELWWPILLGISRSVGDERKKLRMKSLEALMYIINTYFFPSKGKSIDEAVKSRQLQTLQLVFRGVLTPVLEFGEVGPDEAKTPEIPSDFDRFMTGSKDADKMSQSQGNRHYWLDFTFDQFFDGCIDICTHSVQSFGEDTLVEEVFAMLNSCLLSDSGGLAVRGLRRLDQFITSDLKPELVTDDTWATACHMLRRCLAVRGLPKPKSLNGGSEAAGEGDGQAMNPALLEKEAIREFVMEDSMLSERRYIGGNAVYVISTFLEGERFAKTLGLRWRLFIVTGLGKAIREWERAAAILDKNGDKSKARINVPPHYLESAFYGRKWMNRFLLQIASMKEVAETATEGSKQAAAQALIKEQTQSLVTAFLEKEAVLASDEGKRASLDSAIFERLTSLVMDMLAGYAKLPDEHVSHMSWLNPVLSSCIHTSNESIRISIQKLVQRLHD